VERSLVWNPAKSVWICWQILETLKRLSATVPEDFSERRLDVAIGQPAHPY
jgi:hypothetical protein